MVRIALAALLIAATTSCAAENPPPDGETRGTDAISEPTGPVLMDATDVRFGTGDDDFNDIAVAAVVFDSLVAAGDAYANRILLFRGTEEIARIGRQGEGPMEFEDLGALAATEAGLVALDRENGRVTVMTPPSFAGEGGRSIPLPSDGFAVDAVALGNGGLGLVEMQFGIGIQIRWVPDMSSVPSSPWRSLPVLDFIEAPEVSRIPGAGIYVAGGPDSRVFVGWPKNSYRIESLDLETGEVSTAVNRDLDPPAITDEEREAENARRERASASLGVVIPANTDEFHPHYSDVRVDPCDRVWVLTHRVEEGRTAVDVFGEDGSLDFEARLSGRVKDLAGFLAFGALATIVEDEIGRRGLAIFEIPDERRCGA